MGQTLQLVGLQWGDEGKGKVIDALAGRFDVVIRFQGGANAGHTVQIGEQEFVLHLAPTGILRPQALSILGNGMVIDPAGLIREIEGLREQGVKVAENLVISDRAHVVLPHHKLLDRLRESARAGGRIGTTGRGIGPCYADKATRDGIRFCDLMDPAVFRERLEALMAMHNPIIERVHGAEPIDCDAVCKEYCAYAEVLRPHVRDTVPIIRQALDDGRNILLEGAQGSLLDVDFGTYPFVTSSPVLTGAHTGSGIPASRIDHVLGLAKAYCSRVGAGPFPTEQDHEVGETIPRTIGRLGGREFGATSGRQRRCGWLDGVALRYTARLGAVDSLAVSVLDVLGAFETIKVCTAYRLNGQTLTEFPSSAQTLARVEPVYEELEGWRCDISEARSWGELPPQARAYLEFMEELAGAPVEFVSVGPKRTQVIERRVHG